MCKSYYARSSTNALFSQSTKYYECFECDDGFSVKNSSTYATHINQCVKVPRTTVAGYNYDTQCRVVYQNYTWDVETELSGKDGKATIPQDPVCAECTPHHFYATPDRQGCVVIFIKLKNRITVLLSLKRSSCKVEAKKLSQQ